MLVNKLLQFADVNPCAVGDEPYKRDGRNFACRAEYANCPASHYCHVGADEYSTVCCPRKGRGEEGRKMQV
jgi:hypothetical protein